MPELGSQKYIRVAQGEGHGEGEAHGAPETHAGVEHEAGGHSANPLAHHPPLYYSGVGLFVIVIMLVFVAACRRNGLGARPADGKRGRPQLLLEQCVASITDFTVKAIGPGSERFVPLVGTIFSFVLISNLMGVLPTVFKSGEEFGHKLPAPTANLSTTLAIALVVFFVVQWAGIKENGVGGWLKHFAGPIPALSPLMFPLELIGALAKPLSLSIRLFGNVFGEETVIAVLVGLAVTTLPHFLPIPFQLPMLIFGVFGALVQAGVFTILTCAYISLSIGEHDHHGHGAEHDDIQDEFGAHVPVAAH